MSTVTLTLKRYDCCDGTRWCAVCHACWSMAGHCPTHNDKCREHSEATP